MSTKVTSLFRDPEIAETLSTIHDKYNYLKNIFILDSLQGNPTYTATTLSKEEIIDNHLSVLYSFVLSVKVENCDLHLL